MFGMVIVAVELDTRTVSNVTFTLGEWLFGIGGGFFVGMLFERLGENLRRRHEKVRHKGDL